MNIERVDKIANAVLYEGYILYPYRASAVKNQQRFNFGVLAPQAYSQAQRGNEAWRMQIECLVLGDQHATLDVRVRFLHLLARDVGKLILPVAEGPKGDESDFQVVASLEVGGQVFHTWQEAVEREINTHDLTLKQLMARPQRVPFSFPAKREVQPLRAATGQIEAAIIRQQQAIDGEIEISAEPCEERLFRITIRVLNLTPCESAEQTSRDEALTRSLVSAHAILGARDGEFVSLLDPPEKFREAAGQCQNIGIWPVLVGEPGERDLLLCSPIILYDYPQVAPESLGDLFDGAEIDEILTLRIMALTDEEKREMRDVDERSRRILERTETLPVEQLMKLHGAWRSLRGY